jgi:3-hydroxyacyl-CoA dehydrogenase
VILDKIQLFNPVRVMKRVKVVRSILTSDATIATLLSSVTSHRQWSIR